MEADDSGLNNYVVNVSVQCLYALDSPLNSLFSDVIMMMISTFIDCIVAFHVKCTYRYNALISFNGSETHLELLCKLVRTYLHIFRSVISKIGKNN